MLKRTRGYILLTLLVLTGFAGQVSNQTISSKERHVLVSQLKTSKTSLLQSLEGLSDRQVHFRDRQGRSICSVVCGLEAAQKQVLASVEASLLSKQAGPQAATSPCATTAIVPTMDADALVSELKSTETSLVKYIRTTTEDLHGHSLAVAGTSVDAYQVLLRLPVLSQEAVQAIAAVKASERFPK